MFYVHTQDIVSYTYYVIWANNYLDVTVTMQHQARHRIVVLIYNNIKLSQWTEIQSLMYTSYIIIYLYMFMLACSSASVI